LATQKPAKQASAAPFERWRLKQVDAAAFVQYSSCIWMKVFFWDKISNYA
jgi:hypothetical protein